MVAFPSGRQGTLGCESTARVDVNQAQSCSDGSCKRRGAWDDGQQVLPSRIEVFRVIGPAGFRTGPSVAPPRSTAYTASPATGAARRETVPLTIRSISRFTASAIAARSAADT